MYLCHGPIWWPCIGMGEIRCTLPNGEHSGLCQKPLDTTIGWLLTLYCPDGRMGPIQNNEDERKHQLCWPFQWSWQCASTKTLCIAQWRRSRASEATGCHHLASIWPDIINWSLICCFFVLFFVVNLLKMGISRPLFIVGVWHVKLKGRT